MRHRLQNNNENQMSNEQQQRPRKNKNIQSIKIAFPQLNNSIYGWFHKCYECYECNDDDDVDVVVGQKVSGKTNKQPKQKINSPMKLDDNSKDKLIAIDNW